MTIPTTKEQLQAVADNIASLCCNVSIRDDENGPFILAFGMKDTHSLELRKIENNYIVELWHGMTAEEEVVVEELSFSSIEEAKRKAEEWLMKDAI